MNKNGGGEMKRYLPRYPLYLLAWVIIAAMMTCISILCAEAMGTLTDYLAGHGLAGSGRLAADAVSLYGASAAAEAAPFSRRDRRKGKGLSHCGNNDII